MNDDLLKIFRFFCQHYMAIGLFEDAETVLKEAIDLIKDDDEPNPWRGYNLALLGKLYIEWERIEDAEPQLSKGWKETQATWNIDLVPLVRNFYAELLMHPHNKARDLIMAKQLLRYHIGGNACNRFSTLRYCWVIITGSTCTYARAK